MDEFKPKTFWEKPEGKFGQLVLLLVILGIGFGLFHFLPLVIVLMHNIITASLLASGIAAVLFLAMDKQVQLLIGYSYKLGMKKIVGTFIERDPIALMEIYVGEMGKRRQTIETQISSLNGELRKVKGTIDKNAKERDTEMALALQAEKRGMMSQKSLKLQNASNLKQSNETLSDIYTKMELLYRVLSKMTEAADYEISRITSLVRVKKTEFSLVKSSYKVTTSIKSILNGNLDEKALFELSMEAITDDMEGKMGEMKRFMDISSNFLDSVDLEKGALIESGLKDLEDWTRAKESPLLGSSKALIIDKVRDSKDVLDLDAPASSGRKSRYNILGED